MKQPSPSRGPRCPPEARRRLPPLPEDDEARDEQLAAFAKALAHPVRVRILRMLARRDARMCAEIVDELPLAQSTVSEHLRVLRSVNLITARENGARTGFCIEPAALERLRALLKRTLPSNTVAARAVAGKKTAVRPVTRSRTTARTLRPLEHQS